ncbi:MAG: outer membrane beta-barrel protein [Chryseolinea sp.]
MAPGKYLYRAFLFALLIMPGTVLKAQQFSMSVGLHTGIMSTYTMDNGISRDPRYRPYYGVKFAPIGANLSVNYEYIGFVISPSLINVGQDAYVLNTSDGDIGDRKYNLKYLNIPVGFKVHIVNMAFLKISGVVSLSAAYLLSGSETVSHAADIMEFPKDVYPILPPDYNIEYDGVSVPAVDNYVIANKQDFRPMQVFAGAGLQSDWDVSNNWRVFFDLRVNYGLFDPRTKSYLERLDTHQTLYDIPGQRHDIFAQLSVGIARYIDFEKKDVEKKKKQRSERKGYSPKKYPYRKPRNSKPGG